MPKEYGVSDGVPSQAEGQGYKALSAADWTTLTGADVPVDVARALNELAKVGASSSDPNAIHDNVANEISALTLKAIVADDDIVIIEDSAASFVKKKAKKSALGGTGGTSQLARCFITAVTGSGTISNKTYEANTVPASKILTAFESDDNNITLTIEIHTAEDGYMPADVKVSGGGATPVTVTKGNFTQLVTNGRVWTASVNLTDADTTGTLTAFVPADESGDSSTVTYTRSLDPPTVLTAVYDNQGTNADPYPGIQTQVSSADTVDVSGTAQTHADEVYVKDFEVTNGEGLQGPFTVTAGVWSGTINVGTGTLSTSRFRCYAKVTGGTAGADFTSSATVDKDQTVPTFSSVGYTYPGTQNALKGSETCDVAITHTNAAAGDTYLYDDNSTSELSIPATTTYAVTKTVTRVGGTYRDSGTNYRVTATRTEKNGLSTTKSGTVEIANVAPTINITNNGESSPKRFRSRSTGGNKTYTITITSDQDLHEAPTLARDAADDGPALGTFSGSGKVWTATITIEENDTKNTGAAAHDFTSLVCQNQAETSQSTINSGSSYIVGGFEQRDIALVRFDEYEPILTMASNKDNANKLICEAVGIGTLTYKGAITQNDGGREFTITDSAGVFKADGDYVRCTDGEVFNAADYTLRIEESP